MGIFIVWYAHSVTESEYQYIGLQLYMQCIMDTNKVYP